MGDLRLEIPVVWSYVRQVRDAVTQALHEYPDDIQETAAMVAAELVGNAIKYGDSVPEARSAEFQMAIDKNRITMTIRNAASPKHVNEVQKRIDQLIAASNAEEPYLNRIDELMNKPATSGRLGLYRVASEGRYSLEYQYDSGILTVTAVRGLP